ncbi:hypothetical protein BDD12DRAFT_884878 [Trichophaea hybrida]|nr:hypothetical protein BDD12DRAFT_884878 [Trichophaea hybrida]
MLSSTLSILLFGILTVNAAPRNYAPLQTVYETMTMTISTAVTLTGPCTPKPTACAYNHDGCYPPPPPPPETSICPYEHGCNPPEPKPTSCPDGFECIPPTPEPSLCAYEHGCNPPEPEPTGCPDGFECILPIPEPPVCGNNEGCNPLEPEPPVCGNNNDGCNPPEPEPPVCADGSNCFPQHKGSIGYKDTGLAARNNGGSCGANNAPACPDGSSPRCTCQYWGWECVCPPETGRMTTITHTSTATVTMTYLVDGGVCPTPTPTPTPTYPPAPKCPSGSSHEVLIFDDVLDSEKLNIQDPFYVPKSPFEYRRFTFDPDWAFALCENLDDERALSCNPTTPEGSYYASLYYQLDKPFISRVSRRITYDLDNDYSSWEVLSYSLTTFPKPGQTVTILLCAWSIYDQNTDIEPTFCHAEYFTEHDNNILRNVEIDYPNQELAFIEFTSYDEYYAPGTKEQATTFDKGLRPVEFLLDDMAVCLLA